MSTVPADVETRLAELERALRRWRRVSIAATAFAVLALLLAARSDLTGEVRANKFALLNDRGDEVGGLGFDGQGEPRLALTLQRGKATVLVGALVEDLGGLSVTAKDASIMIATDSTGSPSVSVHADKRTASLSVVRDNDPTLLMTAPAPNLKFIPNLSATPAGVRVRLPDGALAHFPTRPAGGSPSAPAPGKPQGVEKPPDQSKN
jgi:hypothetical protein